MKEVLLLTPLIKESDAIAAALIALGHQGAQKSLGRLPTIGFPALSLTLAVGGHGKAQFGIQTQHLIDQGKFDLVICAGAAGSLHESVGVGDIVASTTTIEHDYTERFTKRPLPRFAGHPTTLEGLRRVVALTDVDYPFRLHFGPIASGDEDVVCSERARELAHSTAALCVAWEGSGAARACRFSEVPCLELRGVTDVADKAAPQDFETNLPLCMGHIARLLHDWLPHANVRAL